MRHGLLLIGLVLGCSGAPLATEFELAHAKEAALDDDGALHLYRLVRTECERPGAKPREHDDCALALVREAQLLERHHRWKEAYDTWLLVPKRSTDRRKSARALSRAALIAADELKDDAAAERIVWSTVERFPDEVPSDDALALGVRLGKKRDPGALALRLEALWPNVAKLDIGDNVLYERAELQRTRADSPQLAVPMYDQLARDYPRSGLRDDAIWHAAELLRANGDPKGALKRLRIILESRRDALITGSYNSLYLDDAQLLFGQILLDDLREVDRAIEAFATLADDYPESVLQDDGLVELARAHLARHNPPTAQDQKAACDALKRLFTKFPESNRTRQAQKLKAETACPG